MIGLNEADCNHKLTVLISLLRSLGFWIFWKKVSPTGQKITYLGIELDSVMMEFRLPQCKLYRLVSMVTEFSGRETVSKKDLQKLAGHLANASMVVRGGRTFSRRLIDLIKHYPEGAKVVTLSSWVIFDLHWWRNLLSVFNGCSKIIQSDVVIDKILTLP